jgi:hypothetical protein
VSPHFLASDFIANDELPPLLKTAAEGGRTILWVAVSASRYDRTDIVKYQAANNPARPLDSFRSAALNQELVKITKIIEEAAGRPANPVLDSSEVHTSEKPERNQSGMRGSCAPASDALFATPPTHPAVARPQSPRLCLRTCDGC